MPEFVHLHVHSEYSLLDGLSRTKGLAARAQEFGMPAVAITDHGTMFAAIEFHDACKAVGVKPIIGVEAYLAPRTMQDRDAKIDRSPYHLLLLAENETGYKNLLKISSIAQLEGFYQKPRVDKAVLEQLAQGVIATTGCMGAEIPTLLAQGKIKQARDLVDWYRQIFKDRFYVELQEHGIPELTQINPELIRIARDFNLKLVATNDVHYIKQDDWFAQDVLLCVQTGATVNQSDRMRMDGRDYWFKSADEMAAVWADYPEALSTTLEIAERCNVDLSFKGYHLPLFPVPDGFTPESYLRAICEQGFRQRYPDASPEKIERLNYELGVIHKMGFDTYFLIVWDLTRHARERGIWANARGSAAGSMVAYCLGITHLDPLEHNLIFERFLNPDRISMPDIDLDFPDDARQEMINYTVAKYGRDNVAQIITFGKMLAKAALRDVGRALDYPLAEVDRVAKLIPVGPGKTIDGTLEEVKEFRELYENSEYLRKLIDNAKLLEGVARNASTHAAGVVVTDKPVIEYTPLHRPTRGDESGTPVTQFPMGDLEHIGLLKIDFLGLAHLTIVREACKLIRERHGIELTLQNIPVEDPKAFELLSRGDVVGVFQVEGGGLKRVLMQMRPTRFDHIVAAISLYRPGPMENIPSYIARLHGQEKIEYRHPALEPILGETFGICVSGDAIVFDARTGQRLRLDQVGQADDFHIQGIDADWRTATGRVTHWVHNGRKAVFRVRLRNGASIKVTADHRLLTENGWQMLKQLAVGDYIATPPELLAQENSFDSRKLRVLAYLLADGDLGNLASVNFVSKDSALLDEYKRCLSAFENIEPRHVEQARQVTRVTVSKQDRRNYHQPNSLLDWLRTLGLKRPSGSKPGGLRSHEKFVPDFVFTLRRDDIAYFLASLWDCDGYVGNKLWHYKTISARLAQDVQTLLLKLGIPSTIYQTGYVAMRGLRSAYQVTVYDTARLAEWLQPFFVTAKREQRGANREGSTLARAEFLNEVESVLTLSKRVLMREYGIDRQHFAPRRRQSERISTHIASALTAQVALPETARRLRLRWEEIVSIEPAGFEDVYDLTVEGLHNFVANNIIVHNCVYQEQIIRMARDLCGFTGGEADTLRKAVGKKNKDAILRQREKFIAGAEKAGIIPGETAAEIFADIEFFARYGFNKSHAAVYAVLTGQTAYLKAHYPLEYMTALLCTDIGNTEKVAMFVADARHQGIQVLPPDVRYSSMKFTIDDSVRGIRFGLLGVKNVGEGPIQAILDGRRVAVKSADGETHFEDKPFESLDDFCTRVDLKQVNRRVLESLIKAGAFDAFGARSQLLETIDRMLSVSASHHNASAAGQMSLFGGGVAVDTFGDLPLADEVNHKTLLEWEKELMGVYFSPHPLLKLAEAGKKHVGAYTGEITPESDGHQVTIGGILKSVRQIITKKGDAMAFLNLEDPQGEIEVVAFPRTYNDCRDVIHEDALVLVRGKVQVRDDKIAVLADLIWNYPIETPKPEAVQQADRPIPGIFSNTPVIAPPPPPRVNDFVEQRVDDWLPPPGDWDADMTEDGAQTADDERPTADDGRQTAASAPVEQNAVGIENADAPSSSAQNVSSGTAEAVLEWNAETAPPENSTAPAAAPTENAPAAPPLVLKSQVVTETKPAPPPAPPPPAPKAAVPEINLGSGVAIPSKNGGVGRGQHSASAPRSNAAPAHVARENTSSYLPRTNSNLKVRVRFQRSYDQQLDTKRMREVVKLLRSADGRDRFALIVPLQSSWVELDFPNYYTNFQTVQQQLLEMVSDWGEVEIG